MLRICFETEHYKIYTYEWRTPFSEITIIEYNSEKKKVNIRSIDLENKDRFYKGIYDVFGMYPKEYLIGRIEEIKEIFHQIIRLSPEPMSYIILNSEGEEVHAFPINSEFYVWLKVGKRDLLDFGYGTYEDSEFFCGPISDNVYNLSYLGEFHYGDLSDSIIRYWVTDIKSITKTVMSYIETSINIKNAEEDEDWLLFVNTLERIRRELFNHSDAYCNANILKEFADYYVELNWDKKGVKHDRRDFIKFLNDFGKKEIEELMLIKPTPFLICLNKLIQKRIY